jgi:hypothetical protein
MEEMEEGRRRSVGVDIRLSIEMKKNQRESRGGLSKGILSSIVLRNI